ncbi:MULTISPECIES: hypothetical protein [Actinosynnema]|uniref:hypothetical protein n=1 Tax=Actinosynnema TaxID=40566 RepID=UPI0020A5449F|nr:hypothetical protein [Actinosynnema pretiosum]MCP2098050.1 hypothetical protein [Actinosynnema pretiosum]
MPDTYSPSEQAALFLLMTLDREVPNAELVKEHKVDLRKDGRERLNKDGLIASEEKGRRIWHRITPEGAAWCRREFPALELPARSGPLARALFELARPLIIDSLSGGGSTPAEVVESGGLDAVIRDAYRELSVKPQDWVRLAKLRPRLSEAVDAALRRMLRHGEVHLAPDSNRKVLTDADHAAAIRIGDEDKHLIAIEEA